MHHDFTKLSKFSIFTNCHFEILDDSLYGAKRIFSRLCQFNFYLPLIDFFYSSEFELIDILGSGIRVSDNSFLVSNLSPNDTIYFYLQSRVMELSSPQPSFQFQVRYINEQGERYIRVLTYRIILGGNNFSVVSSMNYNCYLSSTAISIIREFLNSQKKFRNIVKSHELLFPQHDMGKLYLLVQSIDIVKFVQYFFIFYKIFQKF